MGACTIRAASSSPTCASCTGLRRPGSSGRPLVPTRRRRRSARSATRRTGSSRCGRTERAEIGAAVCAGLAPLRRREILSPVLSRDHDAVTYLDGSSVVVWPFRPGRNGFEAPQSPRVLETVGQVVRMVHDAPIPLHLRADLPREPLDDRWRRGARQAIGDALPQHRAPIERLAAAADRLAGRVDRDPRRWVLCHADLHAGNVLVGRDAAVTILDWDSAMLAPRERDLMFPGAAVSGTWASTGHVESFLARVQLRSLAVPSRSGRRRLLPLRPDLRGHRHHDSGGPRPEKPPSQRRPRATVRSVRAGRCRRDGRTLRRVRALSTAGPGFGRSPLLPRARRRAGR